MDKWISVEIRMPEDNKYVWTFNGHMISVAYYEGLTWWDPGGWWHSEDDITHWMPITKPEPPEDEMK